MRAVFVPILAGGNLRDRVLACVGALFGIGLTSAISASLIHPDGAFLLIAAPMGAAAVLVFAVPASPLAQPWPVVGGNVIAAIVGVTVAKLVPAPEIAAGIAVAAAILAMSVTRSLHPPAGAVALTAVVGGPAVLHAGYAFAVVPVALNAVILMTLGVLFHKLTGHSYPHRTRVVAAQVPAVIGHEPEDIDNALIDLGDTLDVSREDLDMLVERIEYHAARRRSADARPGQRPRPV